MIAVGQAAPLFELESTRDGRIDLKRLRGRPVVLYFYPQADTPGCTVESKAFRDLYAELTKKGVEVLGISVDGLNAQQQFSSHCSLPFPLLADPTKATTTAYGVLGPSGKARRVTFFIDGSGTVSEIVDTSKPDPHIARAKALYL